jgi:hypothetical protein
MAMKKTTNSIRPGQGQPGGPPNPTKLQISSGVTVLGGKTIGIPSSRKPLTNAQMKELKAMIAKTEAQKAAVKKNSKSDAKIIKKQNKQAASNSKPVKKAATKTTKPVVKVTPPRGGGMRGGMGFGGGGGLRGNVNR